MMMLFGAIVAARADAPSHTEEVSSEKEFVERLQTLKPGESVTRGDTRITSHGLAVGRPGPGGWYSARSTEGGFTARFPGPFADVSGVSTIDGVQMRDHLLSSKSPMGTHFMLLCFDRVDGGSPERMVEQTVAGVRRDSPDATITEFSQGSVRGQAFEAHDSRRTFSGRVFLAAGQACQFTALYLGVPSEKVSAEIQETLKSFRPRAVRSN
jgi:hypothetical protein